MQGWANWIGAAIAAMALGAGGGALAASPPPALCHTAREGEASLRPLTQAHLKALIAYNAIHGRDVWMQTEVAAFMLPEDQYESGPGKAVTLKTDKGDYILFEQATDAIGALFFAHRTRWGDLYVFRLDHDMVLKASLVRQVRSRWIHRLDNCQAQRHLDIVLDEWAQVMDMEHAPS
jgi:hypothetical protein